ncbi:Muramoyltetrapeptide carboxypeptidase [Flavobacteriaceae bacterium 3519-10]|nr:Muramoyltetrapeptide carboxypeptidase [Flavobacteriaceae bacterium 3519-10]
MRTTVFPASLKNGDKIAVISPAGSVNEIQLEKGLELIKSKGYEAVLGPNLYTEFSRGYSYAGTETERISDMNWALNDSEIATVWTSRGGYGCQHLLPHIKLDGFRKNPKWYIGYSDNTAVQSYLLKKGYASLHAQTVKTSGFGVSDESYALTFDILEGKLPSYAIPNNRFNRCGSVTGQLVGGNLALIYALLATPYSFDFKDRILFIEDIGEKFYALDRMLMSLELAGVFKKIKGLIVGGMTLMEDENDNKDYEKNFDDFAYSIISERISGYDFPVLFGFPNGHIFENWPLIIGADVKVEVGDSSKITF